MPVLMRARNEDGQRPSLQKRRLATYAATRRFCFTIAAVERLALLREPFRFGLSDWFRFKLS